MGPRLDASAPDTLARYSGQVLDLSGKPAANVLVQGYIISNNSGSLVSNNSASYAARSVSGLRTQAGQLEARTDAAGRFSLATDATELNIEAVLDDNLKAIKLNVPRTTQGLQLQLAYTGSIAGRVTAPSDPSVTNFEGVDVFIPGTSYLAKADRSGSFSLTHVAVGTFDLVATKTGLGRASLAGVAVASRTTTQSPDLVLAPVWPLITSVTPGVAAAGAEILLKGENFGASSGEVLQVFLNGVLVPEVKRLDDQNLRMTVPTGATSGKVTIVVGGVSSEGLPLKIVKSMALYRHGYFRNFLLLPGESRQFEVWASDHAQARVSDLPLQWRVEGTACAVDSQGKVTVVSPGTATLVASLGSLTATASVYAVSKLPALMNDSSVTTLAGNERGYLDGATSSAQFEGLAGIAVDRTGNVFVADSVGQRIRKITPQGMVSTFAGTGVGGHADGPGDTAQFASPRDLVFDDAGNLYVAEISNSDIRKITPQGMVSTLVPQAAGIYPGSLTLQGNALYVADGSAHRIYRVELSNGAVSPFAGTGQEGFQDGPLLEAQFGYPVSLTGAPDGSLYVLEVGTNQMIRRLDPSGQVRSFSTESLNFGNPGGIAVDTDGHLIVGSNYGYLFKITIDGQYLAVGPRDEQDSFTLGGQATGLCMGAGGLYVIVSGEGTEQVRLIR